jgi:hypothetical protein
MTKEQKQKFQELFNLCWNTGHRIQKLSLEPRLWIHVGFLANKICESMGIDCLYVGPEKGFANNTLWIEVADEIFQEHDLILDNEVFILPQWMVECNFEQM